MDGHLRRLERAALQGELVAEARLLLERVRSGELQGDDLALLAYLGHAPARAALPDEQGPEVDDLALWSLGLARWSPMLPLRAAAIAAREVLPHFERAFPQDARPREAVAHAEAACLAPGPDAWHRSIAAATLAYSACVAAGEGPPHWAACAAQCAAEACAEPPDAGRGSVLLKVRAALDSADRATGSSGRIREVIAARLIAETLAQLDRRQSPR